MTRSVSRRHVLRLAAAACVVLPAAVVLGGCEHDVDPARTCLSVSLNANAGTGFEWTCIVDRPEVLELTGTDIVSESNGEAVSGGPISYVFFFEARSEGTAMVDFAFKRPWETNVEPSQSVTYRFSVDADLNVTEDSHQSNPESLDPGVVYWG